MGQTSLDIIAHSYYPTPGTTPVNKPDDSPNWQKPGNALSGSSERFYLSGNPSRRLKEAKWLLVWNPNCGNVYNSVRLVKADNGPNNEVQIGLLNAVNYAKPLTGEVDLVVQLNDVLDELQAGTTPQPYKQIIMETRGSTTSYIYKSKVYLIWESDEDMNTRLGTGV